MGQANGPEAGELTQALATRTADIMGQPLQSWEPLAGGRGTALRVGLAGGRSVIAKVPAEPGAFARTLIGIEYLDRLGLGDCCAALLGQDPEAELLVLESLDGPSLAELLLGGDSGAALSALVAHAALLGDLAAASRGSTLPAEPPWFTPAASFRELDGLLGRIGLRLDSMARAELSGLEEWWQRDTAFTPADTCPDNNAWSNGRLRLFDLDGSGFRNPALEAAYHHVQWPTCWCLAELPEELKGLPLKAFLERFPVSEAEIATADGAWAVLNLCWVLGLCLQEDPAMRSGLTTYRQMLVWRSLGSARSCREQGVLPALSGLLEHFAARARDLWPGSGEPIPLYPAFRP